MPPPKKLEPLVPVKAGRGEKPKLQIYEKAWLKLLAMRNAGPTEIAFLGITPFQDPFVVTDFIMAKQKNSPAYVEFDDDDLNRLQADMVFNKGMNPDQFRRIWVHTHPSYSATPSGTDWDTFSEHFEAMDWSVMLIVGRGRPFTANANPVDITAVLRVRTMPNAHEASGQHPIWVDVDMEVEVWTNEKRVPYRTFDDLPPAFLNELPLKAWQDEYTANVQVPLPPAPRDQGWSKDAHAVGGSERAHAWEAKLSAAQITAINTLTIPWDAIGKRYGLDEESLAQLKALESKPLDLVALLAEMEDQLNVLIEQANKAAGEAEAAADVTTGDDQSPIPAGGNHATFE